MKKLIITFLALAFLVSSAHALRLRAKIITGTHIVWVDSIDFIDFDGKIAVIQSSGRIRIISGTEIPIEK